jgi:hypothetical protein
MLKILGGGLRFVAGAIVGCLGVVALFVAYSFAAPLLVGPPRVADLPGDGKAGAEVRVSKVLHGRVMQRCRGACDEIRP